MDWLVDIGLENSGPLNIGVDDDDEMGTIYEWIVNK